jgi:hypothetical protein
LQGLRWSLELGVIIFCRLGLPCDDFRRFFGVVLGLQRGNGKHGAYKSLRIVEVCPKFAANADELAPVNCLQ